MTSEPLASPGAACLTLAWQHRDRLLNASLLPTGTFGACARPRTTGCMNSAKCPRGLSSRSGAGGLRRLQAHQADRADADHEHP